MLVDRVMRSNAVFLVSGFRCECLLPNKEEKSEEAWESVFSFGHFDQSVAERGVVCRTAVFIAWEIETTKEEQPQVEPSFYS